MCKFEGRKRTMSNTENMLGYKYEPVLPIDIEESKKSNILVTGTNQQGKSLLAMAISDRLTHIREPWQILVFDNVGHWKNKSSIPLYYMVSETTMKYVLPKYASMIYDISNLLPVNQKEFCEWVLADLWKSRIQQQNNHFVLVLFEEFQLYAKNVRGNVSQNILRIMSVGSNHGIRCLGITPDMSLIDCAFIRLAQQRYHFKLGNEPNAKRRFRAYYGLDWCRIARHLDVGFTIYVNKEKLEVCKIPLFQTHRIPQAYREPVKPKPKGIIHRILTSLSGSETEEDEGLDEDDTGVTMEDEDLIEDDLF